MNLRDRHLFPGVRVACWRYGVFFLCFFFLSCFVDGCWVKYLRFYFLSFLLLLEKKLLAVSEKELDVTTAWLMIHTDNGGNGDDGGKFWPAIASIIKSRELSHVEGAHYEAIKANEEERIIMHFNSLFFPPIASPPVQSRRVNGGQTPDCPLLQKSCGVHAALSSVRTCTQFRAYTYVYDTFQCNGKV